MLKENINGKDYFTHRIRFEAFVVIDDEDMPSISKKVRTIDIRILLIDREACAKFVYSFRK